MLIGTKYLRGKFTRSLMKARASDIDMACIKGYNWPVYRGGPMFWADTIGLDKIIIKLKEFEASYGADFTPSPLLERVAREGGRLSDIKTF